MTDENEKIEITVSGIDFLVSTPYAEGHELTKAEARAINQLRASRIGSHLRKLVTENLDSEGTLSADAEAECAARLAELDAEFEFTLANTSGGAVSPVESRALIIARKILHEKIREADIKIGDYKTQKEEAYNENLHKIASSEAVIAMAQKALDEEKATASAMDEIQLT